MQGLRGVTQCHAYHNIVAPAKRNACLVGLPIDVFLDNWLKNIALLGENPTWDYNATPRVTSRDRGTEADRE